MADSQYIFRLDEFNEFIEQVKQYPYHIIELKGQLSTIVDESGNMLGKHQFPGKLTDLEIKLGGVFPYYIRGEPLPPAIAADELPLAYNTILHILERDSESLADAFATQLIEEMCMYKHLPELLKAQKALTDLYVKYAIPINMSIALQSTPAAIPKNFSYISDALIKKWSPDRNAALNSFSFSEHDKALALYFMNWSADDELPYRELILRGELNWQQKEQLLEETFRKSPHRNAVEVAIGW